MKNVVLRSFFFLFKSVSLRTSNVLQQSSRGLQEVLEVLVEHQGSAQVHEPLSVALLIRERGIGQGGLARHERVRDATPAAVRQEDLHLNLSLLSIAIEQIC